MHGITWLITYDILVVLVAQGLPAATGAAVAIGAGEGVSL